MRKYAKLWRKGWLQDKIDKEVTYAEIADELGCSTGAVAYAANSIKINNPRSNKNRKINIPKDVLENYILNGKTSAEIAKIYGHSKHAISKHAREMGIDHPRSNKNKRVVIPREELKNAILDGKSYIEICDTYGCSLRTIKRIVRRLCITRPKPISECANRSEFEKDFTSFLDRINVKYEKNRRSLLDNKMELDVYFPEKELAIELNGNYWHKVERVGKKYHKKKSDMAEKAGIRLIHIFENEWLAKRKIVEGTVRLAVDRPLLKVKSSVCTIRNMPKRDAAHFFRENHLLHYRGGSVRLGLYFDKECVASMTFRRYPNNRNNVYKLVNLGYAAGVSVSGGAEKLFAHFLKEHSPQKIIAYNNTRLFDDKIYNKLGFVPSGTTPPVPWFVDRKSYTTHHRDNYTHKKMDEKGFPKGNDDFISRACEHDNLICYYDCGSRKFIYHNE